MNPFWKTILTTVIGAASVVGASYTANWIANHTYRANRPVVARLVAPVHWRAPRHVTAPHYFRRSALPRTFYREPSRH